MSRNRSIYLLLSLGATIVFCSCASIHAQDKTAPSGTKHIVIVNKKYEPFKEINIGDEVRLILTNSMRVKGNITSIDSTFFTVDSSIVLLNEVESISTKKEWVQFVVGTVLLAGGIASFASYDPCIFGPCDNNEDILVFLGLGLTGAAIAVASPGYHKMGKSKWLMVISNNQIQFRAHKQTLH